MPVIATNTTDRSSVTSQISSILGNPKIPAPDYRTTLASYYESETQKLQARNEQRDKLSAASDAAFKTYEASKAEYQTAINDLPPGDPGIVAAREKYYADKKAALAASQAAMDFITG